MEKPLEEPTEKQWKVIGYIFNNTGREFKGETKLDAQKFIAENIEYSKKCQEDAKEKRLNRFYAEQQIKARYHDTIHYGFTESARESAEYDCEHDLMMLDATWW